MNGGVRGGGCHRQDEQPSGGRGRQLGGLATAAFGAAVGRTQGQRASLMGGWATGGGVGVGLGPSQVEEQLRG